MCLDLIAKQIIHVLFRPPSWAEMMHWRHWGWFTLNSLNSRRFSSKFRYWKSVGMRLLSYKACSQIETEYSIGGNKWIDSSPCVLLLCVWVINFHWYYWYIFSIGQSSDAFLFEMSIGNLNKCGIIWKNCWFIIWSLPIQSGMRFLLGWC